MARANSSETDLKNPGPAELTKRVLAVIMLIVKVVTLLIAGQGAEVR